MADFVEQYVGVGANGTKARPEETVMIVARGCFRSEGNNAAVNRIGPSRLVAIVFSAVDKSSGFSCRFSGCMIPAMLMSTLSDGCSFAVFSANDWMLFGSDTSSVIDFIPGLAAIVSSSDFCPRPAMMT